MWNMQSWSHLAVLTAVSLLRTLFSNCCRISERSLIIAHAAQSHFPVFIMSVMLSPFNKIRPKGFRVFFFKEISSASSRTRFMYSSNPMIRPSILISFCSNSQNWILDLLCKNRKIRLIGWVMIRWTLVVAISAPLFFASQPDRPQASMHARTPAGNAVQAANRNNFKHTHTPTLKPQTLNPLNFNFCHFLFLLQQVCWWSCFCQSCRACLPKLLDGISFVFNMRLESLVHIC